MKKTSLLNRKGYGEISEHPEELSDWCSHFRHNPPDSVLLRRIAAELVEMRVLLFNIHRDPSKSPSLHPAQIAPDLFGSYDPSEQERKVLDNFGSKALEGVSFGISNSERDGNPNA